MAYRETVGQRLKGTTAWPRENARPSALLKLNTSKKLPRSLANRAGLPRWRWLFAMLGISSIASHVGGWPAVGFGVIWLVAYCISNKVRWRRFLVLLLVVVVLVLVLAWWLLADGGMLSLIHAYREISGKGPPSLPKP
jgi:hypothetical protein